MFVYQCLLHINNAPRVQPIRLECLSKRLRSVLDGPDRIDIRRPPYQWYHMLTAVQLRAWLTLLIIESNGMATNASFCLRYTDLQEFGRWNAE